MAGWITQTIAPSFVGLQEAISCAADTEMYIKPVAVLTAPVSIPLFHLVLIA